MSEDRDPFGIEAFFEKLRNKDPEATALMERIKAEQAARSAGYKAGLDAAFQKFPWPFVIAAGVLAWGAAAVWLALQFPVLVLLAPAVVVVYLTWKFKGWKLSAIVAAVVLALGGGLYYYDSRPPDQETKRLHMYRQDSTYCSKYATKREEARELLAWEWPSGSIADRMRQELTRGERDIQNLGAKLEGLGVRHAVDYEACMLGQGWEKEWIAELAAKEKARVDDCRKRGAAPWTCK